MAQSKAPRTFQLKFESPIPAPGKGGKGSASFARGLSYDAVVKGADEGNDEVYGGQYMPMQKAIYTPETPDDENKRK